MGGVGVTLFFLVIGSPFLALWAWHAWRDIRGARRNAAGCCYSCGCTLDGRATPISHHKGGCYLYCRSCATFHRWVKNSMLLAGCGVIAAAGVVMFLSLRTA